MQSIKGRNEVPILNVTAEIQSMPLLNYLIKAVEEINIPDVCSWFLIFTEVCNMRLY